MRKFINKKSGYTLVELIIYIGILSFISVTVITTLFSFVNSYRNVSALRLAENSGVYAMERIYRDTLFSSSVDDTNSTFDTSPGVLTLVATDGDISTTTRFYVQDGILKVNVNGSYIGPLNGNGTQVTNLVFRLSNSGISSAVRVDMTISATSGSVTKQKTYHRTVVLRK